MSIFRKRRGCSSALIKLANPYFPFSTTPFISSSFQSCIYIFSFVSSEPNFAASNCQGLEERMGDIQLATHTVKSHGKQLLRTHIHDWMILLLLAVIDGLLNLIEPFHRFVGRDMMTDLSYPMKGNTVPFLAVPVYAVIFPIIIFTVRYLRRRDLYDLHHAILGILYSVLITAVITDAIKDAVGRPRPNFFWRCFPDGKAVYDPITTDVICHGDKSVIKEGHKSFPSGHSSWSFAGLGFLAWYLSGKIQVFDRRGHVAKLCIVFLPLLCAALVAISRVDDYWHHWQDVFTGGSLGLVIASFCYLQFFPAPYELDGWGPHAYFHMLAEMQRESQAPTRMNSLTSTTQLVRQQDGVDMGDESPELEEMEKGRRH